MLEPAEQKFRKQQRGRMKGIEERGSTLAFGDFGMKALEPSWVTGRQLESARVVIAQHLQQEGRMWMRVFPDKPVTKTPAETRMGKGKGEISHYVSVVKPGRVLFELAGIDHDEAEEAIIQATHKLPIKTKFIYREVL